MISAPVLTLPIVVVDYVVLLAKKSDSVSEPRSGHVYKNLS